MDTSRSCTDDDCSRVVSCRDLCKMHYERRRRLGEYPPGVITKKCSVSNCESKHMGRGLCHKHYRQKYSRIYDTWYQMVQRCTNPRNSEFKRYGGRGIIVCVEWRENWKKFASDMGPRPEGFSLDRIDPNGNYEPGNCRWADKTTQSLNQRKRSDNKSGARGVYYDKNRNNYQAEIKFNGNRVHLGRFKTQGEAINARKLAEQKYHAPILAQ